MTTRTRVAKHTAAGVNEQIREKMIARLDYYATHPEEIDLRLNELDEEWDIERVLEMNSSVISLFGLTMGFLVNRRWFLLPLAVQSFFFQHAVQGWCPPLPVLRRLGARTSDEINSERYALKALRGDFKNLNRNAGVAQPELSAGELVEAIAH